MKTWLRKREFQWRVYILLELVLKTFVDVGKMLKEEQTKSVSFIASTSLGSRKGELG